MSGNTTSTSAQKTQYFTLANGLKVPSVGLGSFMGEDNVGEKVEEMVKTALKIGYRHVDTALGYGNEEHVGKAIRESGIPREEIFVTTKLAQIHHGDVVKGFETSLKNLDIGYIDLYLMHWPQAQKDGGAMWSGEVLAPDQSPTFVETWLQMEKLLETKKVRAIGVSNFSIKTLEVLLPKANIVPAVNQVELHPCLPQVELVEYCRAKGIHVTAYSPLGQGYDGKVPFFTDPSIVQIAKDHNVQVSQVVLSHTVQRGVSVIPKSSNEDRLKQNISIITLNEQEMKILDDFHKKPGMHRTLLIRYCQEGSVFGWTFEQLGWNLAVDGQVKH